MPTNSIFDAPDAAFCILFYLFTRPHNLVDTPTILLGDVMNGTSTNNEGAKLYAALAPHLVAGTVVRLSLRGTTAMSSSFLNSSIGDLIDCYGILALRRSLKLVDYVPSHVAIIKEYINDLLTLETA